MHRARGLKWDEGKARANLRKHRIDFADAAIVLEDGRALTVTDDDQEEERFVTIGMDALGRVLVVINTIRGERVRIISARRATRRERAEYEQNL
ncbi:MAG: BrnT family toxin [Candidatus Binataceae bacterium]